MPPIRIAIAGITVTETMFESIDPSDYDALLCQILDWCAAVSAEQAAQNHAFGNDGDMNSALVLFDVTFPFREPADTSILGRLTTDYPALNRSLRVLKIAYNDYNESADISAFAALATHLRELSFYACGLTSVRGLEGRCEYLQKVHLWFCKQLGCLKGLAHHAHLQDVIAAWTPITSIEPLRTCRALTTVNISSCRQLSSMDALAGHQRLQVIDASHTNFACIEPLRTCPSLAVVSLSGCLQLSSMDAFTNHHRLQVVDVSNTAITSMEPLRSCLALTKVDLRRCEELLDYIDFPEGVEVSR